MSRMRLIAFASFCQPMEYVVGQWRHRANRGKYDFARPEYWQDFARICERGKFDGIFLGDALATYDTYRDSIAPAVEYGARFPIHDPLVLVPYMADVTEHVGIAPTISSTYYSPYLLARKLSTLDHLTGGRIGWNIVTSMYQNESDNMGLEELIPHDERYDRADEFVEVCNALWESSWEDDAVVEDVETGRYADPMKINRIDYEGEYFSVPGPHFVRSPSPQGKPVIFQAGQSDRGREFAARHAESVFTIQVGLEQTREYASDIKERAAKYRDDPESINVFLGVVPIIAETEEAAEDIEKSMYDLMPQEGALAMMSQQLGHDFSQYDERAPLDELELGDTGSQGLLNMLAQSDIVEDKTLPEIAKRFSFGASMKHLVGTPEQIADEMERYVDEGGIDGFNVAQIFRPGTMFDFVEEVVPILQERGLVREEYAGGTFRENLQQE